VVLKNGIMAKINLILLILYPLTWMQMNGNIKDMSVIQSAHTDVKEIISSNFAPLFAGYKSPIFPYRVGFKCKDFNIKFCNIDIIDGWALKEDSLFCFYLMMKNEQNLLSRISTKYGKHAIETSVSVNESVEPSSSFIWEKNGVRIYLQAFLDMSTTERFRNCCLVIITNMKYRDILHVAGK
jgi:hypothetical protein